MRPPSQSAYCTTREAAQLLGISLRTAQLWVENGQLDAWNRGIAYANIVNPE